MKESNLLTYGQSVVSVTVDLSPTDQRFVAVYGLKVDAHQPYAVDKLRQTYCVVASRWLWFSFYSLYYKYGGHGEDRTPVNSLQSYRNPIILHAQ